MPLVSPMGGLRLVAANALALLSFALFAAAVLSLHQERSVPFALEEAQAVPAALSHNLFGAKNGLVDSGLSDFFLLEVPAIPAEEGIERALKGNIKQTHVLATTFDGTGIGPIVMVSAAFALFGPHARSLPYFFVLVLGISSAAFMLRFQDRRIFAIPLLFSVLTALTLSPLTLVENAASVPFGGMRSYAIVGILATLHWCFEIVANSPIDRRGWIVRSILLSIQIAVLGFSILVRGSPGYLFGPVLAVGLYRLGWHWDRAGLGAMLWRVAAPAVALVAVLLSITPIAYPDYARTGRAYATLWHRLFVTMEVHPAWPFPGLREKYSCPEIPEGLVPHGSDRNGQCIWLAYAREHNISLADASRGIYGTEYEKSLRSAMWYVVRTYPKETLETFFIYKPELIVENTRTMLNLRAPDGRRLPVGLFVLQCAILVAFMITWPLDTALADIALGARLLSLFLAFGLAPQLIAWALPPTAVDFSVYVMCGIVLGVWSILAVTMKGIVHLGAAPARSS